MGTSKEIEDMFGREYIVRFIKCLRIGWLRTLTWKGFVRGFIRKWMMTECDAYPELEIKGKS